MVHAPPINYLSVLLLPFVFRESGMVKASELFSKTIFWLENIVYILAQLLYELLLVPYIYFRHIFNIIKAAKLLNALWLITIWLVIGLFFLLYCVFKDMYFYLKILCDYKEDDVAFEIK